MNSVKKSNYKYVILVIIMLCGVNNVYFQYQLSPVADQIMGTYGLVQQQYSTLFTAPMAPAIFICLICGMIVDKIGARKIIFAFLSLAALAMWARIFVKSYTAFYICMLLPGFGATFVNSTNAKIFGEWFAPKKASIAVGLYLGTTAIGMAVATATTALLPSLKFAYIIAAVFATMVAILWILFIRDKKSKEAEKQTEKSVSIVESLKTVIRNRDMILGSLSIMCVYGCYMVISSFLPLILQNKGMGQAGAGAVASLVSVGYLIGCIIVPVAAGKVGKLRGIIFVLAALGMLFSFLIILAVPGFLLSAILILTGFCLGGILPLYMSFPIRIKNVGVERAGTAGGLITTFQLLGAVVIPAYVASPIAGDKTNVLLVVSGIICAIACVLTLFLSRNVEESSPVKVE